MLTKCIIIWTPKYGECHGCARFIIIMPQERDSRKILFGKNVNPAWFYQKNAPNCLIAFIHPVNLKSETFPALREGHSSVLILGGHLQAERTAAIFKSGRTWHPISQQFWKKARAWERHREERGDKGERVNVGRYKTRITRAINKEKRAYAR